MPSFNSNFTLNIATVSYEGSLFTWKGLCSSSHESESVRESEREIFCELEMTSGFHCSPGSLKALAISKSGEILFGFCCYVYVVFDDDVD